MGDARDSGTARTNIWETWKGLWQPWRLRVRVFWRRSATSDVAGIAAIAAMSKWRLLPSKLKWVQ